MTLYATGMLVVLCASRVLYAWLKFVTGTCGCIKSIITLALDLLVAMRYGLQVAKV